MSADETSALATDGPPAIFPLPSGPNWCAFGKTEKLAFGWTQDRRRAPQFRAQKVSTFSGWSTIKTWPRTEDGWQAAWEFMRATYPELAESVAAACHKDAARHAGLQRRAEYRSILEGQEKLGVWAGACCWEATASKTASGRETR